MTVLSKDILTMPEDEIPTAQVVYTIVGGKIAVPASPALTLATSGSERYRAPTGPPRRAAAACCGTWRRN